MSNDDDDDDDDGVAPTTTTTIWVGGTSALAQTYVEEILIFPNDDDNNNNNNNTTINATTRTRPAVKNNNNNNNNNNDTGSCRHFILAAPDPPALGDDTTRITTRTASKKYYCYSYQKLDMTKRNSIDEFFDRIIIMMENEKSSVTNNAATAAAAITASNSPSTSSSTTTTTITITIIFGMRASLVTGTRDDHLELVDHVPYFIEQAKSRFSGYCSNNDEDNKYSTSTAKKKCCCLLLKGVLHISSVAVMDHTKCQLMLNEDHALPAPTQIEKNNTTNNNNNNNNSSCYSSPYDLMKRQTEDVITSTCKELGLKYVHLRISGVFSNEVPQDTDTDNDTSSSSSSSSSSSCIQMSAIRIQSYVGCYIQTPLDMNTSRNVCHAMRLILDRLDKSPLSSSSSSSSSSSQFGNVVYFYTRPTIRPRPYGDNLVSYRSAHNIWYAIDVPDWFARIFLWTIIHVFRILASVGGGGSGRGRGRGSYYYLKLQDILGNVSYLLTVSMVEHTFDNSRVRSDFPELNSLEENITEGFIRIRNRRRGRRGGVGDGGG